MSYFLVIIIYNKLRFVLMLNSKRFYWLAQLIGWASYSGLLTFSVHNKNPDRIDSIFVFNIIIAISAGILITHGQRMFFIRMGWLQLRLPKLIPKLIFLSLISSFLITLLVIFGDYFLDIIDKRVAAVGLTDIIVNVFAYVLLVLFWNAIYFTFHFFRQSRKQEISNLELKAKNRESELNNLRSQLNPHFLFNSLNSIKALINEDPSKSKVAITTLSSLLRRSLVMGAENLVSLENEIGLAKSYLELEKIRFEERLNVEWELTPGLEDFEIPPFTLQMMVENAIKHGISNLKNGGKVKITATDVGDIVSVQVINSGSLNGVSDLGVGIENIKQRLALQYQQGAEFKLEEIGGCVIATMNFKK